MTKIVFCQFDTFAMFSDDVDILPNHRSFRKEQVGAVNCVIPSPSWVVIVVTNTSIGAAILFSCHPYYRDIIGILPNRDATGTRPNIPGLSQPFRDSWQLCSIYVLATSISWSRGIPAAIGRGNRIRVHVTENLVRVKLVRPDQISRRKIGPGGPIVLWEMVRLWPYWPYLGRVLSRIGILGGKKRCAQSTQ